MSDTNGKLPDLPAALADINEEAPEDFSLYIPGRINAIKGLTMVEKGLLAIVDGLYRNGRGCYASNKWIAPRLSISVRELSRLIAEMEEKGWIVSTQFRNPKWPGGRMRFLIPTKKVPLKVEGASEGIANSSTPPGQNVQTPTTGSPDSMDSESRQSGLARACLESVVNKKQKEKKNGSESSSSAQRCDDAFRPKKRGLDDDDPPGLLLSEKERELVSAGLSPLQAQKLADPYSLETIQAAIQEARNYKPERLPAYLCSILQGGTWRPPKPPEQKTAVTEYERIRAEYAAHKAAKGGETW